MANSTTSPMGGSPSSSSSSIANWNAFTLEDAYKPRPTVQYIVDGLFEIPSLNIVYGSPGSLKSFLMADLSVCVAGGKEWLSIFTGKEGKPFKVVQGTTAWLDFDNGKIRTHERFAALGRAYQMSNLAPLYYYSMPSPWLDVRNKTHVAELAQLLKDKKAKLVIIDNLGTISGGADENSSEMIVVLGHLRWLSEETGTAIILIHHPRKSNGKNGGRVGDSLRGHSSIEGSLDLALLIKREGNAKEIFIQATKVRGAEIAPFSALFTYQKDSKGQLAEARFFSSGANLSTTPAPIKKAIIDSLGDKKILKTELAKLAYVTLGKKIGQNRIRDSVEEMIKNYELIKEKGSGSSIYILRNPDKSP